MKQSVLDEFENVDNRAALRREVIARRHAMEPEVRAFKSSDLCMQLLQSLDITLALTGAMESVEDADDAPCSVVAVYSAFPDEVQLHEFIEGAYNRGVRVAFPCMTNDAHSTNGVSQNMEMRIVSQQAYEASYAYLNGRGARKSANSDRTAEGARRGTDTDVWGAEGSCTAAAACNSANGIGTQAANEATDENLPCSPLAAETCEFLIKPLRTFNHSDAELADYPYVPATQLTMLVVPMVAFDKNGNRLGYGGGNYDRYLTQIFGVQKPDAQDIDVQNTDVQSADDSRSYQLTSFSQENATQTRIVGVAFAEQEVDAIPTEPHDIPLPIINM